MIQAIAAEEFPNFPSVFCNFVQFFSSFKHNEFSSTFYLKTNDTRKAQSGSVVHVARETHFG